MKGKRRLSSIVRACVKPNDVASEFVLDVRFSVVSMHKVFHSRSLLCELFVVERSVPFIALKANFKLIDDA